MEGSVLYIEACCTEQVVLMEFFMMPSVYISLLCVDEVFWFWSHNKYIFWSVSLVFIHSLYIEQKFIRFYVVILNLS